MEFYNVKKRAKVQIADAKCTKVIYKKEVSTGTQERYAVRAQDDDGVNLTKFITKDVYESLKMPVGKAGCACKKSCKKK